MFTGIILGTGRLTRRTALENGARITVETELDLSTVRLGDSIAIDGCCLTAVTLGAHRFEAELGHETLARTTLGARALGSAVNLERSLAVGDRLDGHLVQGHVDAVARVVSIEPRGTATDWRFSLADDVLDGIVPKGSVAIDGISLTVNAVHSDGFSVSIIPHTAKITSLGSRRPGDSVNIETDIIGRYVAHLLRRSGLGPAGAVPASNDQRLLRKLIEGGFHS